MTKLGWRLLTETDALWSQVMRLKYCAGRCDIDMFVSELDASNAWRGIVESSKFIKQEERTEVGNEENKKHYFDSMVACLTNP